MKLPFQTAVETSRIMVCVGGFCIPLWQLLPLLALALYKFYGTIMKLCMRADLPTTPMSLTRARGLIVRMINRRTTAALPTILAQPSSSAAAASSEALTAPPSIASLPLLAADEYRALLKHTARVPGAAVLVKLGATWCPPCRAIEPFFNNVAAQVHAKGMAEAAEAVRAAPDGGKSFDATSFSEEFASLTSDESATAGAAPASDACCNGGVCAMPPRKPAAAAAAAAAGEDGDDTEAEPVDAPLIASSSAGNADEDAARPTGALPFAPLPRHLVVDVDIDLVPALRGLALAVPTFLWLEGGDISDSFRGADRERIVRDVKEKMGIDIAARR